MDKRQQHPAGFRNRAVDFERSSSGLIIRTASGHTGFACPARAWLLRHLPAHGLHRYLGTVRATR